MTSDPKRYAAHRLDAEGYWQALLDCGWVDSDPRPPDALRDIVLAAHAENRDHTVFALAASAFDMDVIEGVGPDDPCSYYSILEQLAEESYGLFKPDEILDDLDEEARTATVIFVHNGERYAGRVPWENDWFDPRILELVNQALEDAGHEQRYLLLPSNSSVARLALVSPDVYAEALERELIPPDDFFLD